AYRPTSSRATRHTPPICNLPAPRSLAPLSPPSPPPPPPLLSALLPRPPRSTLFPYTTLFRSTRRQLRHGQLLALDQRQQAHAGRSAEHTSELQSRVALVCRLLLDKKKPTPAMSFDHERLPSVTAT